MKTAPAVTGSFRKLVRELCVMHACKGDSSEILAFLTRDLSERRSFLAVSAKKQAHWKLFRT
jgi:hypothetical protein